MESSGVLEITADKRKARAGTVQPEPDRLSAKGSATKHRAVTRTAFDAVRTAFAISCRKRRAPAGDSAPASRYERRP
jgi:hypothetical protein